MEAVWHVLIAAMLTTYVVLDGFDFGAGIVHLFVARTDDERRSVFAAVGPVWDGNEVWLIASGGVLVFAFPRAYAVAFSGLYLPLMMVLWLLIGRGIAIEFRSQHDNPLWRAWWDGIFAVASTVMALVLGVALGNVLRGVPIDASGWFSEDLFPGAGNQGRPAAIDGYTGLFGIFSAIVLAAHGATYLQWKLGGSVGERSRTAARRLWMLAAGLAVVSVVATAVAQPIFFARFVHRPWLWVLPVAAVGCLFVVVGSLGSRGSAASSDPRRELRAFLGSAGFVAAMLLATAGALFPTILRSTIDESLSIDAYGAASGRAGLATGLMWWVPALVLAIAYFTYMFRSIRGKLDVEPKGPKG